MVLALFIQIYCASDFRYLYYILTDPNGKTKSIEPQSAHILHAYQEQIYPASNEYICKLDENQNASK